MIPSARKLLLIRPAGFAYNAETAVTNSFQKQGTAVQEPALAEFDQFVNTLNAHGIETLVIPDTESPAKPDAVFPNNWFSTTENGALLLYPMQAESRRNERRNDIIEKLKSEFGYQTVHDFSACEKEGKFLEGTGSIVFDHLQRIAYAALSPRTDRDLLLEVCEKTGYLPLVFQTADRGGKPVYHTNVMLALHEKAAVVCFDCIPDASDRRSVQRMLEISGKTILQISIEQMESFAGNMLFVKNRNGEDKVILSERAWYSLNQNQQEELAAIADPVYSKLETIENCGGGSARCMLAELF